MGLRVRRDLDPAGAWPSPARAGGYRLRGLQCVVDPALHALSHPAGRRGPRRLARRHPAGRPPPCRRAAAGGRTPGRSPARRGRTAMSGPEQLSASAAAARLSSGELTSETLTAACLERARAGAEIKAWAWLDPEQALAQARAVDRAGRKGAL